LTVCAGAAAAKAARAAAARLYFHIFEILTIPSSFCRECRGSGNMDKIRYRVKE
jgi:hypothetical protein